jgi:GDP-D-mannose dehydratase
MHMTKRALITGITGQDGAYLAEFLLAKGKAKLGWEPRIKFQDMVSEMVRADLEEAKKEELCVRAGFAVNCPKE